MAIAAVDMKARILIVDDDNMSSQFFSRRLERRGFQSEYLNDESKLLEILKEKKYDLLLLDIMMPTIDGITLLQKIREAHPIELLPVIMVTSLDDNEDLVDAFRYGANDYVTKPINIDSVVARINGQLSLVNAHSNHLRATETKTIGAMSVTYHHELNNPMAIAYCELQLLLKESQNVDREKIERVLAALDRMSLILKQIEDSSSKDVTFDEYASTTTKMVKLKR